MERMTFTCEVYPLRRSFIFFMWSAWFVVGPGMRKKSKGIMGHEPGCKHETVPPALRSCGAAELNARAHRTWRLVRGEPITAALWSSKCQFYACINIFRLTWSAISLPKLFWCNFMLLKALFCFVKCAWKLSDGLIWKRSVASLFWSNISVILFSP